MFTLPLGALTLKTCNFNELQAAQMSTGQTAADMKISKNGNDQRGAATGPLTHLSE